MSPFDQSIEPSFVRVKLLSVTLLVMLRLPPASTATWGFCPEPDRLVCCSVKTPPAFTASLPLMEQLDPDNATNVPLMEAIPFTATAECAFAVPGPVIDAPLLNVVEFRNPKTEPFVRSKMPAAVTGTYAFTTAAAFCVRIVPPFKISPVE